MVSQVRSYIVFFLIVVMLVGLGVLLVIRSRPDHEMPVARAETVERSEADAGGARDGGSASSSGKALIKGSGSGAKGGSKNGKSTKAPPSKSGGDGGPAKGAKAPEKLLDRPFRVIGHGWEVIAPGLVANRGTEPGENSLYTKGGLEMHLSSSTQIVDLERALARGGADPQGADVAIMPLPIFIAAYEQLRALSPKIFFVFGWSHGHEALLSHQDDALLKLPRNGNVKIVTDERSPSHFFGLYVLDLAGVPPDRVDVIDRGKRTADSIAIAALRQAPRGQPAGAAKRRFIVTTADANRLIPYVAVAPEGTINTESDALRALCSTWLKGVEELKRDVPAAARRIASIRGTPEALELLGLLGRVESSTLRENAEVAGLSGRGAITIDGLFENTWRIWRAADVLTSPMPNESPVTTNIIAALVRQGSSMADGAAGTLGEHEPSRRTTGSGSGTPQPILVYRIEDRRMSNDDFATRVGMIAGVFGPLSLRVAIPGDSTSRARTIIESVRDRFGVAENRLTASRRITGRATPFAIELLPP